ncbi:protein serine/threonine phosphatase [Arcobacter nitrofigilis DSM 7299]|uniref:Protein serine/threonine phosphatase n=1 Tax=Arcobacter nitrofigilis (strain ATCC 33309 / DSM 7299 / CCUG 15893 / LMG 7604 / NCTC 12251 / CI) TaxID=572480 RepID=D5V5M7_ARCNC|nr:bifunctional protein-serine/threonine kinase/phosphatase [Arcobacter nitrofigilis]ADG92063.1 protein serine/threonine phosphatase [Arcobacter nitrofigilis DSM 7299]
MNNQLKVSIGQYSIKGIKDINQDFYDIYIPSEPLLTSKGIAIAIADGISSSKVSQEASKLSVISFLQDYYSTSESWSVKNSANKVLKATNSWLYSQNRQSKYHLDKDKGFVCTFSALIIKSNTAHIFHVGDTRVYKLKNNNLEQLTTDHRTWISNEKSYLSRALGIDSQLTIDYETTEIEKDDIFLLMTDGVYEFIDVEFINKSLKNCDDYNEAAKVIVQKALKNHSDDNLTIQIIKIDSLANKDSNEIHQQILNKAIPPILEARKEFEGYFIIRELSATSRSHVYLAKDNDNNQTVVIKTPSIDLQDDKAYLERFLMEEWIAKRVNNPYVAKAYNANRKQNYIYTVFEYIDAITLSQWMIDNPKPKIEVVRNILEQIARGLMAFHRLEMIHQDIRPENIMIDKTGSVKIIDFGSTRIEGILEINTFMQQEKLLGTALYSAPEYFLGEEGSVKSDIFSLGAITYQMLSNKLPYGVQVARANTKSAQNKLKYITLYPEFPLWIDGAIRKALNINPNERYSELSEFLFDLKQPNKKFLNKKLPPLIEKSPIVFWQSISLILFLIILLLINNLIKI